MVNASALAVVSVGFQGARGRMIEGGAGEGREGVNHLTFFRGLP